MPAEEEIENLKSMNLDSTKTWTVDCLRGI